MKRNKKFLALLLTAALLGSSLSGCALLHFDDPAEIKAQEQELEKQQSTELPDIKGRLDAGHLVMDEVLHDAAGKEIARYQARFPWFDSEDSAALDNINQHYESEFGHLQDDKDRFFKLAAEKPSGVLHTSVFDYELLDARGAYVAVLRSFESVDSLGESGKLYTCEVFSAATGLRLKFSDVFSGDSQKAVSTLRADLAEWSKTKESDTAWLDGLTDEVLCENFTFSSDTLYIGFDKNIFPGGETLVELPLEDYAAFMAS